MSKSIKALLAAAVVGLFAWGCEKYDDTALNKKIDGLDTRVTALEKAVQDLNNTTIPGLKSLIEALQKQVSISSVTPTADGYVISFSDGTKATLTNGKDGKDGANGKDGKDGANGKDGKDGVNGTDGKDGKDGANGTDGKDGKDGADGQTPVIGVKLVDGVYCWTVNGELLLDANQQPIPVTGANGKDGKDGKDGADGKDGKDGADGKDGKDGADAVAPQFRITDGVWEVSVDGGTTWAAVPVTGSVPEYVIITETEVAYVFTFADESTIVIPKEQVFCLVITPQQETTDIYSGETLKFDYVVKGASAEDDLLVDILNITPSYWAFSDSKVVPDKEDATKGVIEITSQTWDDKVQYKIFIHAANGKGKTDTKVIVLTSKTVDAVFDVALEAAAGGEYAFEVKSNSPFNVVTDVDWIVANETKAAYEWHGSITIAANETNEYRDGYVRVIYEWGEIVKEFYVLQEPATDKATDINNVKYNFADGTEGVKANHLTVIATGEKSALVTDGSEYMVVVLKEDQAALESGKVYDFSGTVTRTEYDEHSDWWSDGALTEAVATVVEGVEPVEVEFMSKYTYFDWSWYRYNTTILYGKLDKEDDSYVISLPDFGPRGKNYILLDPATSLKLDELVGKNVFVKAWLLSSAWADGEPDTYTLLPIEAKAFELKEATTSLEFSFDKYYSFGIKPAEGISYTYQYFIVEDPTAEGAYKTKSDIENAYTSNILNMLQRIGPTYNEEHPIYSVEDYVNENIGGKEETTISCPISWGYDGEKNIENYPAGTQFNVLAWAWDKNGPTGEYILKAIEKEAVPYKNYLGYWQTDNGVWKVEEQEANKTYKVRGVLGDWDNVLEFRYDNGNMMLIGQDINSPEYWDWVEDPGYYVRVLAGYYGSNLTYEDVLGKDFAAAFVRKDGNMVFTPLVVAGYRASYMAQNGFNISSGNWYNYYGYMYLYTSAAPIDPSEEFLAWSGDWNLGDVTITITPQENSDRFYDVVGLIPGENVPITAQFDMSTGNIEIYGYQWVNANYKKNNHKYQYYLVGQPDAEGLTWIANDKLATLSMAEDGKSATVEAGVCSYDDETLYAKFGLVGHYEPTDDWDFEGENAILFDLPNTLIRPSAAGKSYRRNVLSTKKPELAPATRVAK